MTTEEGTSLLQAGDNSEDSSRRESDPKSSFDTDVTSKQKTILGFICAFLGAILVAPGVGSVQALGQTMPGNQLNLWRFAAHFLLCLPVVAYKRLNVVAIFKGTHKTLPAMLIVCALYVAGNWLYFESSKRIPAGAVGCIYSTFFLVSTVILSGIFSKECRVYFWV